MLHSQWVTDVALHQTSAARNLAGIRTPYARIVRYNTDGELCLAFADVGGSLTVQISPMVESYKIFPH